VAAVQIRDIDQGVIKALRGRERIDRFQISSLNVFSSDEIRENCEAVSGLNFGR
jgi:hypothetical protein